MYLGERYYAVVTDVIGEYTLRDCGDKDDIELQKIVSRCIDILQEIHRKGILHRDIKPSHIIFSKDEPYIIDFGAAGERESETLYATPEYSASCADFVPPGESSDFESLWFSLLSLRQPLPWKYTLSNCYETWILKNQHLPHNMIDRYPLLIQPFLALEDNPDEDNPDEDNPDEDNPDEDSTEEDNPEEDNPEEDNPEEDNPEEDNPVEDNPEEVSALKRKSENCEEKLFKFPKLLPTVEV